jgi:hypothetical protein
MEEDQIVVSEAEVAELGHGHAVSPQCLTVSLSGGGYRATAFAAGAMLAVADSSLCARVASVSSVSGGSITSAVTVGGFRAPSDEDPDPMGRRVRLLAGLVQSRAIRTEALLGYGLAPLFVLGFLIVAVFVMPQWLTLDEPAFLFALVFAFVGGGFLAVTAFPHSWYAVQGVVETLVVEARGSAASRHGTELAEIAHDDGTRRIFCATDLASGSHVYLTPGRVLGPDESGRDPCVYLTDVVAASACFPGFRPIVFHRHEVGLTGTPCTAGPRRHRAGTRVLLGIMGVLGLLAAFTAVALRILGPLDDGWKDLAVAVAVLLIGGGIAILSGRILWIPDNLILVDGGVCDNLGAAFALLAKDDRYPELPRIAGADTPGLMLVIDASKPFTPADGSFSGLGELIPLRIRGAQRSVLKLLGNANASARKHVIQLLLNTDGPTTGAVVAITDVPGPSDGLDWPEVVKRTQATPTTLDQLDVQTTRDLVLQAYRLTHAVLVAHGVEINKVRSGNDINDLVGGTVPLTVREILGRGKGPYARQVVRVRRISQAVHLTLSAAVVTGVGWWWLAVR